MYFQSLFTEYAIPRGLMRVISEPSGAGNGDTWRARSLLCGVLALLIGVSGCRGAYLARLAYEQARYLGSARPISELAAGSSDETQRRRLLLVLEARRFAQSLGMDVGGSFLRVSDSAKARSFHVVTAAYADRLEPYVWWYPLVGSIPYRGYFDSESAEKFARGLRAEGLDTRIVEASAYSTLGWFDDPLPSALLESEDTELVTVVLHELVHQNLFVKGQVAFNETLATSIGLRLAERFFRERGDESSAAKLKEARAAWLRRGRFFDDFAERLSLFLDGARRHRLALERTLAGRAVLYEEAREQLAAIGVEASGLTDNAAFLAAYRYAKRAPLIDAFVARQDGEVAALEVLRERLESYSDPYEAVAIENTEVEEPNHASRVMRIES